MVVMLRSARRNHLCPLPHGLVDVTASIVYDQGKQLTIASTCTVIQDDLMRLYHTRGTHRPSIRHHRREIDVGPLATPQKYLSQKPFVPFVGAAWSSIPSSFIMRL